MNRSGDIPDNSQTDLFPMPLSSMEVFHFFDSADEFPNHIYGRLRFNGPIDLDAATQALQKTIQRQPILKIRIRQTGYRYEWIVDEQTEPPLLIQDINDTEVPSIDPKKNFPWRMIVRRSEKETELWFHAAHVLFDGLGAIQLITNWSNFYHQLKRPGRKLKRLHKLDHQLLKKRNSLGLTKRSYLMNLWRQPIGLLGAFKFLSRRPTQPFKDNPTTGWKNDQQPAVIGMWLESDSVAKLKLKAQSLKVSLNALFVGQLMKTLEHFASENPERHSPWIRVMHPMSIRTIADRKMPACNRTTIVQIDRKNEEFNDDEFFKSLDYEVGVIQGWELGKLFLLAIGALSFFPRWLRRLAEDQKCRGSAIFANLGEPLGRLGFPISGEDIEIGNMRLIDFDLVGPIRSKTPVNFSVQKHLGRYRLSLHYDNRVLNQAKATEVLERFRSSLAILTQR